MNASALRHFAQTEYQIQYWASIQKDTARKHPEISAGSIYQAMIYRPVIGARSLLELDLKGRFAPLKELVGSSRNIVASDTTMLRASSAWDMGPTRMANYAAHLRLRQKGLTKTVLSTGRKVRLAVVDGTDFGGHLMSVLGFVGGGVYQKVDLEPSDGRGHELITSRVLLMRAGEYLGRALATHVLYDGLMADRQDFRFMRNTLNSHLVVKTREEKTLEIIESSKQVWSKLSDKELRRWGVEVIEGMDEERGITYKVCAQGGVEWKGLEFPLKLAWVRETHLKGPYKGQTLEYWVMTTDENLSAVELRELAHDRWSIETGFKEMNERLGSKGSYLKDSVAKQVGMLTGFFGMMLLKAFMVFLETMKGWRDFKGRKTKRLMGWVIEFGLPGLEWETRAPP